jgi:hypothetical protein
MLISLNKWILGVAIDTMNISSIKIQGRTMAAITIKMNGGEIYTARMSRNEARSFLSSYLTEQEINEIIGG